MAPPVNLSDEELLSSAPSASPDALALLYRRHEPGVLAYFVRRVDGNPEVAADLTAQTFLHVVEGRGRFRGSKPGDATAWMYGIAAHVLSRHWRRKGAESRRHQRLISELTPLDDAQAAEIDRLTEDGPLMEALAHLPASLSAATLLIQPLTAAIMAWLILGEPIGPFQVVGGAILLGGIFIARRGSMRR